MRRKKDDKRVLISRNNRQPPKRHRRGNPPLMAGGQRRQKRNRRKKKSSGMLVLVVIIALVGFVVGAGIGVSLTLDTGDDNNETQHFQNVTKQMINNSSTNQKVSYEKEDAVDYNKNQTEFTNATIGLINIIQ